MPTTSIIIVIVATITAITTIASIAAITIILIIVIILLGSRTSWRFNRIIGTIVVIVYVLGEAWHDLFRDDVRDCLWFGCRCDGGSGLDCRVGEGDVLCDGGGFGGCGAHGGGRGAACGGCGADGGASDAHKGFGLKVSGDGGEGGPVEDETGNLVGGRFQATTSDDFWHLARSLGGLTRSTLTVSGEFLILSTALIAVSSLHLSFQVNVHFVIVRGFWELLQGLEKVFGRILCGG